MDSLARAARDFPDRPAVVTATRTVTYGELDAAADGVAALVLAGGDAADHPVAFWGDRSLESVAAVWGIPRAGVAAVPVDPTWEPARAMEATRAVGVRGLFTPPEGGFDRLVERGGVPASDRDGGYVVFTSGSEGRPRGVRLTSGNVFASVEASRTRLGHAADDRWLCVLPLFHVGGLAILWRQARAAAPVVLHERFEPSRVADALGDVEFVSLVPVMLRRVLPLVTGTGSTRLRVALVGGAASDPDLLERARSSGIPAIPTYGMTETTSQIATPRPDEPLDGSVGTALDGAEIRVVSEGRSVVGSEGRIEVRGPMVSPGYVGEPDRAPGGWHVTGDLGIVDADGRLRVIGRADAVIVTGGENVHPAAIENALRAIDGIHDVRVHGVPDPEWGAIVAAEVETTLTVDALDAVAVHLPAAMRPRRWTIVDRLTGKLAD